MSKVQRARLQNDSPQVYGQLYREHCALLRLRALDSLWTFLSEVLENPVLYEPLHRPLADWLKDASWEFNSKLLLLPRGHVKSNILTVGYVLWRICRDQNIRVLVASHKHEDAQKFLGTIQMFIEDNEHFRAVFPEIRPAMKGRRQVRWNMDQMRVARTTTVTENTVECTSLTSKVTGRHYMLLVADDLVTEKNVATSDQLEKTAEFHRLCESLLDPGAKELVLGTRYHFDDEYGRIMDTPDLADVYDCRVMSVTKEPGIIHEYVKGSRVWSREDDFKYLIYPSRYTLDRRDYISPDGVEAHHRKSLYVIYKKQGSTVFANQYMLEPFDPALAKFKAEDIKFISYDAFQAIPKGDLTYFQTCDLSSELQSPDSYTAIVTGAVGPRCDVYITDIFWQNCEPSQIRRHLIDSQRVPENVRPKRVGFEKGPYEKAFRPDFERAMAEEQVYVPICFTSGPENQQTKEQRIMGLQPYIEAGKFHIVASCRNAHRMVEEFVQFPKKTNKDIIDAAAKVIGIAFPPDASNFLTDEPTSAPEKKGVTFDEVFAKMERHDGVIGNDRIMTHARLRFG